MDVLINYHVWGTMLGHYQRRMPKLAKVRPRKKTVLSTIKNDLLHEFTDKTIVSFCNRLWSCVAATGGALTLRTVCLNTELAMGIWHSWLKHLNCWWKAVKNWFVIPCATACSLEKVNFKVCLNCRIWGTISVNPIKFAGYIAWYLHTKSERLAQIRTTMAEIQNFC